MSFTKKYAGFSLIELLIVIGIVGILAAICYPSYQQHVLRSYRSQAITQLFQLANAQEQYLADYGNYAADLQSLGLNEAVARYRFELTLTDGSQGYLLVAQAQGSQRADSECLLFALNHAGQRNPGQTQSLHCWE